MRFQGGIKPFKRSLRLSALSPITFIFNTASNLGSTLQGDSLAKMIAATASNGSTPQYTIATGRLPAGVVLNRNTGAITGTPSEAGTFTFTVRATVGNSTGTSPYTLVVNPVTITFVDTVLPPASGDNAYFKQVSATASVPAPVTYAVAQGRLPNGLTFSSTGALRGVAENTSFSDTIVLRASIPGNTTMAEKPYELRVIADEVIWTNPAGTLGTVLAGKTFSATLAASSRINAPVTFSLISGSLPVGLSIDGATGVINGTVTNVGGTNEFTIRANDQTTFSDRIFRITVDQDFLLWETAPSLGNIIGGTPYTKTFSAPSDNGETVSYSLASGTIPPGLTFTNGVLSGTPQNVDGFYVFVVRAQDAITYNDRTFSVNVLANAITFTPAQTAYTVNQGSAFDRTFPATSSVKNTVTYSVVSGALPSGFLLDTTTGRISGTSQTVGVYSVTIRATDGTLSSDFLLRFVINGLPMWNTPVGSIAVTDYGNSFSFTFSASDVDGSIASYKFANTSQLPGSLNLGIGGLLTGFIGYPSPANPPTWNTPPGSLGSYVEGQPYSKQMDVTPLAGRTLTYSAQYGTAPAGLTVNPASGLVSGVLNSELDAIGEAELLLTPIPTWNTAKSLGMSNEGGSVATTLSATPLLGNSIAGYAVVDGRMPFGLSLDTLTGSLSGTIADGSPISNPALFSTFPSWVTTSGSLGLVREGQTVNAQLAATPITGTISFALLSGQIPAFTSLAPNGVLAGPADTSGFIGLDTTGETRLSPIPTWQTVAALGFTDEKTAFAKSLSAAPMLGNAIASYGVVDGVMPFGVTLDTATGTLSGTITDTAPYLAPTANTAPIWATNGGLTQNSYVEGATLGFTLNAVAQFGNGLTFDIVTGQIPAGAALIPSSGVIAGTIDTGAYQGLDTTPELLLTPAPTWMTANALGAINEGNAATFALQATPNRGNAITSYAMVHGAMPWGLQLDTTSGALNGTVRDVFPVTDPSLIDRPPVWNTTGVLTGVVEGASVNLPLTATSPLGSSLSYSQPVGQLPTGTTLSNTGVLSGTIDTGSFMGLDTTAERLLAPSPMWTTASVLGSINEGNAATYALQATPYLGNAIASYAVVNGSMPWGLQLNTANGALLGTIADTALVSDPALVPSPPIWTTSGSLSAITEGSAVSVPLSATSPVGNPIGFALVSGQIPAGVTVANTTLIGNATTDTYIGLDTTAEVGRLSAPIWSTATGLGTVSEGDTANLALTANAQGNASITSYAVVGGILPVGATLNTTSGALTGQIADSTPYADPTLVPNPPIWTTPAGSLGTFANTATINTTLVATPSTGRTLGPYNLDGVIPYGTLFNPNSATITGTLDQDSTARTFSFTVRAQDTSGAYTDQPFTITVQ